MCSCEEGGSAGFLLAGKVTPHPQQATQNIPQRICLETDLDLFTDKIVFVSGKIGMGLYERRLKPNIPKRICLKTDWDWL